MFRGAACQQFGGELRDAVVRFGFAQESAAHHGGEIHEREPRVLEHEREAVDRLVLDYFAASDRMRMIDVLPLHNRFGIDDARLIAAGHPERSVLLHRLQTRGIGQMPPLATTQVDRDAIEVIRQWLAKTVPEAPRDPK